MKKQDKFEEKLNEQLNGMEYKPSSALWDRIEQNLYADSFEPAIQQKLTSYSIDPNEKVWTEIEHNLPESKKRKGLIWFTWIALILGIGFSAGYWFNPNKKTVIENNGANHLNQTVSVEPISKAHPDDKNNFHSGSTLNKAIAITSEVSTKKKNSLNGSTRKTIDNKGSQNAIMPPDLKPNLRKNIKPYKKEILKISGAPVNTYLLTAKVYTNATVGKRPFFNEKTEAENSDINIKTNSGLRQPTSNSLVQTDHSSDKTLTTLNQNAPSDLKQVYAVDTITESTHIPKTNLPNPLLSQSKLNQTGELSAVIPSAPVKIETAPQADANSQKNIKDTVEEKTVVRPNDYGDPEQQLSNISITATVGAQMCFMKLVLPVSEMYPLQKSYELRKQMETPALDYNGGFYLNYHLNQKWIISSGIQITSFRQTLHYNLTTPLDTNYNLTQPQSAYLNPKDSIIAGTSNILENRYSFTEIPVLVSYNILNGETIDFDLQVGVSYAFINLVNAYMPDPGCVGLLTVTNKTDFPKMKNLFFASFSPGIGFKINNTLSIGALPTIKVSLKNMTDNNNWIEQRPWFAGLNVYMRKRF
ncbi:MAG: hypothetical protein H7296_02100 [Bacteroidia bacterium]|nr:hypothetical protein [Bacteroidia bacterium]